ncbi:MAG TPA: response regulator [Candidatus Acidoferrales bacterium]|nr:response regulator [Candidatus Acidoferrales bacterium]
MPKESRKQILVVEDEGLIAEDIKRRLERFGYTVPAIAGTGAEALQCARYAQFDLVLMDIQIKGEMDGIATAQALKDEFDLPVIYLTAHADQDTVNRAKFTEPLGYLLKPVGDANLSSVVQIAFYKNEMERRLRASEAWLSTTLASVGDGIIATDPSGEIVFMSQAAEALTGWPCNEAHGRLLMSVLGLCDEATGEAAKNPVFELFPGETRSYTLVSKTGESLEVEVACFENRSAEELLGAIVVVRDIRAGKELEGRLIQSQRMEAIANLAGGLAHDFNNQLMVILGYADELAERLTGEDKVQALAIKQAASLAGNVAGQLLTLSRRDMARFEVLDVNAVIREVRPIIARSLRKGRTLITELGSTRAFVRGDRNQIKQVLLNLALHARERMAGLGELRIETSILEVEAGTPASRRYPPGPYLQLRATDNGEAIGKDALTRIFEPCFTNDKKSGTGTSLGLSIVHGIIARSGGYIGVSSEAGPGTCFEILLPCIGTLSGPAEAGEAPSILLVEDEDSVRRLMHKFLDREGYQLLEARNPSEAEELAGVYEGPIDVLVTDVVMPGMTGPELFGRLTQSRPDLQVLLISGYRHDTLEHQGLLKRESNLLPKPFPAPELLRRIQMLLKPRTLLAK